MRVDHEGLKKIIQLYYHQIEKVTSLITPLRLAPTPPFRSLATPSEVFEVSLVFNKKLNEIFVELEKNKVSKYILRVEKA